MNRLRNMSLKHVYMLNFLVFYYVVFAFGYANHFFLTQFQPVSISHNRDLVELALIATHLPHFLISHPSSFLILDSLVLIFPIGITIIYMKHNSFNKALGISFMLLLSLYFLLQSILKQVSLQPYVPYVILSAMFFANKKVHFQWVIKMARWSFVYALGTAGVWKVARGAVFVPDEFSNILIAQHSNYLTNNCNAFLCQVHFYLIEHTAFSQTLYVLATLLELAFLVSFFTKKYDKWLVVLVITFVFFDQLVMRIPYWTILVSAIPLWFSAEMERSHSDR